MYKWSGGLSQISLSYTKAFRYKLKRGNIQGYYMYLKTRIKFEFSVGNLT